MMNLWVKIRDHSMQELLVLFEAFFVVMFWRVSLYLVPYKKVLAWVEKGFRSQPESFLTERLEERKHQVLWAVRVVARRLLGDSPCLPQALAAKWMLGRIGMASELRIGVARGKEKQLEAHAWLESEGDILIGGKTSPFYFKQLRDIN